MFNEVAIRKISYSFEVLIIFSHLVESEFLLEIKTPSFFHLSHRNFTHTYVCPTVLDTYFLQIWPTYKRYDSKN